MTKTSWKTVTVKYANVKLKVWQQVKKTSTFEPKTSTCWSGQCED